MEELRTLFRFEVRDAWHAFFVAERFEGNYRQLDTEGSYPVAAGALEVVRRKLAGMNHYHSGEIGDTLFDPLDFALDLEPR
ncbi:MAG: hypothetical protein FJZ60_03555 [Chlamydiae bacterium]|nr:hypothetical protein [Chlamydiota bacterium]